jgi:hypothetical protein
MKCSTGERALIIGILHAINYDALGEQLCTSIKRSFFDLLHSTDVDTRALVGSCIARLAPSPILFPNR